MWNKIVVGVGMVAIVGLMVAGVAYAVTDSDGNGEGDGGGGRWSAQAGAQAGWRSGELAGTGDPTTPGAGRRQASSAGAPAGSEAGREGQGRAPLAEIEDLATVNGAVASLDGTSLVLRTKTGQLVEVSLGQVSYWAANGVALAVDEELVVSGYYEDDGTLAASWVTVVATGETVMLRDESGRPMWSGGRRYGGARIAPAL